MIMQISYHRRYQMSCFQKTEVYTRENDCKEKKPNIQNKRSQNKFTYSYNLTDFEDLRFLALDREEWKKLEDG